MSLTCSAATKTSPTPPGCEPSRPKVPVSLVRLRASQPASQSFSQPASQSVIQSARRPGQFRQSHGPPHRSAPRSPDSPPTA
eukprot:614822-Prorocentrum_minimum.AAC.1